MYRRARGFDLWHSSTHCLSWPGVDFDISDNPMDGAICLYCTRVDQIIAALDKAIAESKKALDERAARGN
jgi:hypothetical protein